MASATLTLACLLLAVGAEPTDAVYINQPDILIPIRLDPGRRSKIQQVILYQQSADGARWEQVGAVPPDKEGFPFHAPRDGTYVFKVAVIGRDGQRDPADIYKAPIGQTIVIDTARPQLRITQATAQADQITVAWDMTEDHPDPATFQIAYSAESAGQPSWVPVKITDSGARQTTFSVPGRTPTMVRVSLSDRAGNSTGWIEAPIKAAASADPRTVAIGGGPPVVGAPAPPPIPPVGGPPEVTPPETLASGVGTAPPLPGARGDGAGWSPAPPGTETQPVSMRNQPDRIGEVPPERTPGSAGLPEKPVLPPDGPGEQPILAAAGGIGTPGDPPSPEKTVPRPTPRPGLPALQIINRKQLTLEYEVAKFGPSGIGSAELYVTRDDGITWQRSGAVDEVIGPPLGDPKALPSTIKRSLTVDLPGDGVYGFYLLVKSGAGLGKPPPQNGDVPQMRVEVDSRAPEAKLYGPQPDPNRRDVLVLRWVARDTNLGSNPVTLQWAERKDGSWESIGNGPLPNTGQFAWQVPPSVPHHVYLRLIVLDTAGNRADAVTPEPVLIDLHEPEVTSLKLGGAIR